MNDRDDGDQFEDWIRSEAAALHLRRSEVVSIPTSEVRRYLEKKRVERLVGQVNLGEQPAESTEALNDFVDALRVVQPTEVAPPEWRAQVLEVITESGSRYVIDTINWTMQRLRGRDEQDDPEVAPASHLRRDGETLRLLRLIRLAVGECAVFDIIPLRPGAVWTRRTTTYVVAIQPKH